MADPSEHLKKEDPLERKSLGPLLLALTAALLAAVTWAAWDEMVTRRPWKQYQRDYAEAALAILDEDIAGERKKLARLREEGEYARLRERVAREQARLRTGPAAARLSLLQQETTQLRQRIDEKRARSRRLNGEVLLLKSRGVPPDDPERRRGEMELTRLGRELADHEGELDRLEGELAALQAPLHRAHKKLHDLGAELDRLER